MGFFSSSPSPPAPKISADGTPIAPNRTERSRCWEARDIYFKCLDANNIVDSISDKDKAEKVCGAAGKGFEGNCASSWVIYFKKRRVMEDKKARTMQELATKGAQELPAGVGPIPPKGP